MGDKNGLSNDDNIFITLTSTDKKLYVFLHILGSKATIALIICAAVVIAIYFICNRGAPLIINGNGNGDNNSGNTYSDHSTIASEQPRETDPPIESDPPTDTEQPDRCDEIRYRVVPREGLILRKDPSTAADILRLLPYNSEVISEGCVDNRGWMPVRIRLPGGNYRHGYVFAAYIDPIF